MVFLSIITTARAILNIFIPPKLGPVKAMVDGFLFIKDGHTHAVQMGHILHWFISNAKIFFVGLAFRESVPPQGIDFLTKGGGVLF